MDQGISNIMHRLPSGAEKPKQRLDTIYPRGGGASFSSNSNSFYEYWLPQERNLVCIGEKLRQQVSVNFTWPTFTPVSSGSNLGIWLPNSANSIYQIHRVRVGSLYVHKVESNYGLLKRKVFDLLARNEWISGVGSVSEGYVNDSDLLGSGFSGANWLRAYNGTTLTTTVAKTGASSTARTYQLSFIPHGFLSRHLPLGAIRGPIALEFQLDPNPDRFMTYNTDSGLSTGTVSITVSNPKLLMMCYQNEHIHALAVQDMKNGFYYNDFVSFPAQTIAANSTSATIQYPLSRKSISGLLSVFRVQADLSKANSSSTLTGANTLVDKMGQTIDCGLTKYYFRYNGQTFPIGQPLDNTDGVISFRDAKNFCDEYNPNVVNNDSYYNTSMGAWCTKFVNGGGSPSASPWFNGVSGSATAYSRWMLVHSFRSDTEVMCGLNTADNGNLLEIVFDTCLMPNSTVQVDTFIRYDVFCRLMDDGTLYIEY
jgi:hypothetical protein